MVLLILLTVLLLVIVLSYLAFLLEFFLMLKPGRVIYHGSDLGEQGPLLKEIVHRYELPTEKMVLLEPGAGLGKVSEYLSRDVRWKKVIAVDMAPVIYTVARLRAFLRRMQVQFVRQDIFHYAFPKDAFVYCYLTTPIIDALYREKKLAGRFVVSLTFALTDVEPTEVIPLRGWQKQLLVYDLRSQSPSDSR